MYECWLRQADIGGDWFCLLEAIFQQHPRRQSTA